MRRLFFIYKIYSLVSITSIIYDSEVLQWANAGSVRAMKDVANWHHNTALCPYCHQPTIHGPAKPITR